MTIYKIDYVNGNDGNDGLTWGTAFKTPYHTFTDGDRALEAKSPDPYRLQVGGVPATALFTNLGDIVLQEGALNAEIDLCESAASAWVASANITLSNNTSQYKLGANSLKIAAAAGFTTGKAAYRDFGAGTEKDLSGYEGVTFWLYNSVALLAGDVQINLCSDALGDTPVDTFDVPAIPGTSKWVPIYVDKGSALGAAIRSVSVTFTRDFGAGDISLDDLITVKAAGSECLHLQLLVSKNSGPQMALSPPILAEPWWAIQSIGGTTILVDAHPASATQVVSPGFAGTTETVGIYARATIITDMAVSDSTNVQSLGACTASYESPVLIEGGYDPSTGLQDGETFFNGLNGRGRGLYIYDIQTWSLNRLNFVRYGDAFYAAQKVYYSQILSLMSVCCNQNQYDVTTYNYGWNWRFGNIWMVGSNSFIIPPMSTLDNLFIYAAKYLSGKMPEYWQGVVINNAVFRNVLNIGISRGRNVIIRNIQVEDAAVLASNLNRGSIDILAGSVNTLAYNAGATVQLLPEAYIAFHDYGGTEGDHRIISACGNIVAQTAVRYEEAGLAWKFSPTNATMCWSGGPLRLPLAQFAVVADRVVTITAKVRRDNLGLAVGIVCKGGQIAGVASDVSDFSSGDVDTWETVTISFTPTKAGVVEIEGQAYGGSTYNGYIHTMTIHQAG